jgi:hypothetical protein
MNAAHLNYITASMDVLAVGQWFLIERLKTREIVTDNVIDFFRIFSKPKQFHANIPCQHKLKQRANKRNKSVRFFFLLLPIHN